jgi:hypothetical protein
MGGRCRICGGASTCPAGLYKRVREVGEGEINIFPRWEDVPRGWKVTHAKKRGYYALPVRAGEWELVVVGTAQASRVRAHYGISPRWVGQCRYAFYAIPAAPGEVLYGLVWRRRWVGGSFEEPLPQGTRPAAADPVGRWLVLCNRCGAWAWRGIAPAEGRGACLRCGLGEAVFLPFPEDRPFPPLSERRWTMRHVIIRSNPLVHGQTLCPECGTAPAMVAAGEEAKCLRCGREAPFVPQEDRHGRGRLRHDR